MAMSWKKASALALLLLPFLALFVNHCGNVHGSGCGLVLSVAAAVALLPAMYASLLIGSTLSSDYLFWTAFLVISFAWLTPFIYLASRVFAAIRKRIAQD